jgi:hypothetical protein
MTGYAACAVRVAPYLVPQRKTDSDINISIGDNVIYFIPEGWSLRKTEFGI